MIKETWVLKQVRNEYGKQIRKAYESHQIHERRGNMTTAELRTDGLSNTITTVLKDNTLFEMTEGIELQEVKAIDEQNMTVRHETFGALTTDGSSPKHNNRVMEVHHTEPVVDVYNKRVLDGPACGTITAHGNASPTTCGTFGIIKEKGGSEVGKVGQISSENSQCGSVYSDDGNMATLTAGTHGDANPKVCTQYRIRKLTPRECWRLMDFSDEDFEKAEKVNSNTQLYKQAGNSIVCNVLVAILGQMFSGKENIYKERDKNF